MPEIKQSVEGKLEDQIPNPDILKRIYGMGGDRRIPWLNGIH